MIEIVGAKPMYERTIRAILSEMPSWYMAAGRVSRLEVTTDPGVVSQIAMYRHGTRDVQMAPNVGANLRRSLFHEWAHALDDWNEEYGNPHVFSATDEWLTIHKLQSVFEIPKYRTDMREHFADAVSQSILFPARYAMGFPREHGFVQRVVFPWVMSQTVSG